MVGLDDLEEVEKALKRSREWRDRQRLKAIRLGGAGSLDDERGGGEGGNEPGDVGTWSQLFREGGIEAVLRTAFEQRGRKPRVSPGAQAERTERLRAGSFKRAKEVRAWLSQKYGIELTLEGAYYWLGKVGGVLRVPRKTPARKDAVAAAAFKVELAQRLGTLGVPPGGPRCGLDGPDEHRCGLISVLRKVWTLRGHKPVAPLPD